MVLSCNAIDRPPLVSMWPDLTRSKDRTPTASGRRAVRTSCRRLDLRPACLGICRVILIVSQVYPYPTLHAWPHLFSIELHTPETSSEDTRMASFARGRPCCCGCDVDAMLSVCCGYNAVQRHLSTRLSVVVEWSGRRVVGNADRSYRVAWWII